MYLCEGCGAERSEEYDEDHRLTDCLWCEHTYWSCQGACPNCGFSWDMDFDGHN